VPASVVREIPTQEEARLSARTIVNAEVGKFTWNVSPHIFRQHAAQYLTCHRTFSNSGGVHSVNSPVPYFLLCRAIELQLKARHLEERTRDEVKKEYGHNLKKSYDELLPRFKTLDSSEYTVLVHASRIYNGKGFEYVGVADTLSYLRNFPELAVIERIAEKLIGK
jgi:hypothetical protein